MSLGTASEEVAKANKIEQRTESLRKRMEEDYAKIHLTPFEMDKKEGKWQNYTTNTAGVLKSFIVESLADAVRKISIPLDTEKWAKKERENLANTERLAIGAINLANEYLTAIPEQVDIQSALVSDGAQRGFTALCYWMYKETEGRHEGEIIPHAEVWDVLNTFWVSGQGESLWTGHRFWMNEDDAKDTYGNDKITGDANGKVTGFYFIDRAEEGLSIGGEWQKKQEHKLGYIPVSLIPCGAERLTQGRDDAIDTVVNWGESCLELNRNIIDRYSELFTYMMTAAKGDAKAPIIIEWDSSLNPNLKDEVAGKVSPDFAGTVIFLDKALGQSFKGFVQPPRFEHIMTMFQALQTELSSGGISPFMKGAPPYPSTASGTSQIMHSANSKLIAVRKNVERQFEWLSREIISQYVNGKYGKFTVRGTDKKAQNFEFEVERKSINPKWKPICELTPDMPQDEMQDVGIAATMVKSGFASRQTGMEITKKIPDPDTEMARMNKEKADEVAEVALWEMAKSLHEDGNFFARDIVLNKLAMLAGQGRGAPTGAPQGNGQGGNVPGMPAPVPEQANVMAIQSAAQQPAGLQVPPEVQQAVQQAAKMKQLGLVPGR